MEYFQLFNDNLGLSPLMAVYENMIATLQWMLDYISNEITRLSADPSNDCSEMVKNKLILERMIHDAKSEMTTQYGYLAN